MRAGYLVAQRNNDLPQLSYLFKLFDHQALQLSVGQTVNIGWRHHSQNESDSSDLGNRIIVPPRV
jgi:hypothetical protein